MATVAFRLTASPTFPTGTTLNLYERSAFPGSPVAGRAPGGITPMRTASVDANGYATFTGLEPETGFVCAGQVNGEWRYVSFSTEGEPLLTGEVAGGGSSGLTQAEVRTIAQEAVNAGAFAATTAAVNAAPIGPAEPAGGWYVPFADAFAVPLGTAPGLDNLWYPNKDTAEAAYGYQPGFNNNEMQAFHGSQALVGPEGLELCASYYAPGWSGSGAVLKKYRSACISTSAGATAPAGYSFFRWKPTEGLTFAFEIVCKFPPNTHEANFAFWSIDHGGTNEFDFTDSWGWNYANNATSAYQNTEEGTVWIYNTEGYGAGKESAETKGVYTHDPAANFHRYTTVLYPDNTFSHYIDGVQASWCNKVKPANVAKIRRVYMGLVCDYALRTPEEETGKGNNTTGFTAAIRTATVRSIAVYADKAHEGQSVEGRAIAPGTIVR